MIKVLLIYLLIGVVIMFLLEIFWDLLETELESESELDTYRRSIDQNYFDTLINNF